VYNIGGDLYMLESISRKLNEAFSTGSQFCAEKFADITSNDKAMTGQIIGIVVIVVVLMLSALILAPLQEQANDRITELNNSNATSTFNDITASSWGALSTASIIPYVIVFMVIIGLIIGLARRSD